MTEVDWLLITLAIYLHDLGMVVTATEYEQRMSNGLFQAFLAKLKMPDPKSQAYLGRAAKMTSDERDRFFYQEFVRENHATRIREWITGRHTAGWGEEVGRIADEVRDLLEPLPARFRENLAIVCESHHSDDLNKLDKYPLCQRYGNGPSEMANVQYAALVLRTVDLIHVTKDRTPSIMYKTIRFSDPKGVEEWDKQRGAFAAHHAGRAFLPDDQHTHQILISADFTEERPFFALTEYIAWADTEIKQTKRWCDQSRELADGAAFWLPWQSIRGDLRVEGNQPQQMRFEFDRGRLLELLVGHAIYNEPTVAIRELLQNAIDAVRFQEHLDSKLSTGHAQPRLQNGVKVFWRSDTRQLIVEDSGTGMDLDVIKFHLMRVGSSFYDTPQFASEFRGFTPISRFGIGVLTRFMISDDIEIVTCKKGSGHRIRMTSVQADYLLRDLLPGDPLLATIAPHGTRVSLTLREGVDFAKRSLENILRYWIVLPACPVEFISDASTALKIGYSSPSEAFKSYYADAENEAATPSERVEIISKHMSLDGATYDMAYAVKKAWLPERDFAPPPKNGLPAVCVEGICVAECFPGIEIRGGAGIFGMVSVRGARGLRTTVSRSGLEDDEASAKLGEVCAEMLFEHIRDEVQSIAAAKGAPLSRASTAGKWLCHDLAATAVSMNVVQRFQQLRRRLALIVMETRDTDGQTVTRQRQLVAPELLNGLHEFWTIESRLVDSLGLISRDLGRELSLNEFLTALAPDFNELSFFPLVPDAHMFVDDITALHMPVLVKFSRAHQQTAIRWQRLSTEVKDENDGSQESDSPFFRRVRQELGRIELVRRINLDISFRKLVFAEAEIDGDEEKVIVVRTRMLVITKPGSELARFWRRLVDALEVAKQKDSDRAFARLCIVQALYVSSLRPFSIIPQERKDLDRMWKDAIEAAERILSEVGILVDFPPTLALVDADAIFDATSYWRDWNRDGLW